MAKCIRYVGLDVHADTIAVAVAEGHRGEVRSLGTVRNRADAVRRLVKKLEPVATVRACYEAGPTGYALYWQLLNHLLDSPELSAADKELILGGNVRRLLRWPKTGT